MSKLILRGSPLSTYTRTTRMAAEEKGVNYELQEIDFGSDELMALHPFGRIPVMQHGDLTIYETAAIVSYIDEAFDGPALKPSDPVGRARMWQWVSAINDYIDQVMIREYVLVYVRAQWAGEAPDRAAIEAALPKVKEQLGIIDAALADSDYLAGDQFSYADMFLAPILTYVNKMPEGGELLGDCANIRRTGTKVTARPSFVNTLPPVPEAAE